MAIAIICPLCENLKLSDEELEAIESGEMEAPIIEFEDAEEYAKHIIEMHESDLRYVWASNFLDNLDKQREEEKRIKEEQIKSKEESNNKPEVILGASTPKRELTTEEKLDLILKKFNEPQVQEPTKQVPTPTPVATLVKDKPKRNNSIILITGIIILIGIVAIIFIMRR